MQETKQLPSEKRVRSASYLSRVQTEVEFEAVTRTPHVKSDLLLPEKKHLCDS